MKPRNLSYVLSFCIAAGLCSASPVFAQENGSNDASAVLQQKAAVKVMFKENTMAKSEDEPFSSLDTKIEKYQKGTLIGTAKDGLAEVKLNGQVVYVNPDSFVSGDSAVEALEQQKQKEEEEARRKAEEEKKRQEEEERKKAEEEQKKKEAEEAAKKQAEAAALAAQQAAAQQAAAQSAAAAQTTAAAASTQTTVTSGWSGSVLSASAGVNQGPSGKETYYNLPMDGVVSIMRGMGNTDQYWVRSDGVKMLGNYVMIAANLSIRPRGSLVQTSLGMGIVCDTGGFASGNPTQIDIATAW